MKFWWVNQNQTFTQETEGGYLWSPKRKSNGHRNPYYEFMREVAPGDWVFSFSDTFVKAIGVARSTAYEAPKPPEFGAAGPNWSAIGWRVDVHYHQLVNAFRPQDWMSQLGPVLPEIYSPLRPNGHGLQSVYLTHLTDAFANVLISIIGEEARRLMNFSILAEDRQTARDVAVGLVEWEEHLLGEVSNDDSIPITERESVVLARRGQGKFKDNVLRLEKRCRITHVDRIEHLRASHIRPWRDCADHRQRLDGENGFLLTPSVDHLFDRGFISFENDGELLISPVAHRDSLRRMGVETDRRVNVGGFSEGQRAYLDHHRESVFLQARVNQ